MRCPRCNAIVFDHAGRGNHPHEEMGEVILLCQNGHNLDRRAPTPEELARGHKGTVSRKPSRYKSKSNVKCLIGGCSGDAIAKGLCRIHYQRDYLRRKRGKP